MSWSVRRSAALGVCMLVALAAATVAATGKAHAAARPLTRAHSQARARPLARAHVARGTIRARITGAPILGTAGASRMTPRQAAPSTVPSTPGQIAVLDAALRRMTADYSKFAQDTPGPQDVFDYGIGNLWRHGVDGAGTTIALLEGWNDPQVAQVVASFDQQFGLPNPQISTIYPAGPLPKTCPAGMVALGSYGSCSAWAGELELDVMSAHLMAPYAKIVLAVTPADTEVTADAAQNVAPPEMMKSLEDIAANHLANVVSVSDNTGETTYSNGTPEITAQDPGELAAASAGIPFLVATGDCGVVQNLAQANAQCEDAGTTPSTATWDDSPWATAVGGSVPNVSATTGAKLGPDPLWHDPPPYAEFAEGAGFSSVFARPAYQNGVASITGSDMRSVPDITMDAQDGTSESTPMFAGVLALATQLNGGRDLGPINPVLYRALGPAGARAGIADVVSGNDSADAPDGTVRVPGFTAAPGFDVASGWGTVYAPRFAPSLVAATRFSGEEAASRRQARRQLSALEYGSQAISLSPRTVASGATTYLSGTGFLPGYPVQLLVDGRTVTTLTASPLGDVTDMIDPGQLGLSAGSHTVTLQSLLIDETARFGSQ